jgi:hypothetical protein
VELEDITFLNSCININVYIFIFIDKNYVFMLCNMDVLIHVYIEEQLNQTI